MADLVLVAHGTRSPAGLAHIAELVGAVSERVGPVRTAFVDVLGPSPVDILTSINGPTVIVPAFLASGYHVRQDIPNHVNLSGHRNVTVTRALGPEPALARTMLERLQTAGWRRGDAVVLAAAGSSDPGACRQVHAAARMLSALVGPVRVGYIATGTPRVAEVVTDVRDSSGCRVFIASYLLAHGLFQDRLSECGADGVAEPLAAHQDVVNVIVERFTTAATQLATLEGVSNVA